MKSGINKCIEAVPQLYKKFRRRYIEQIDLVPRPARWSCGDHKAIAAYQAPPVLSASFIASYKSDDTSRIPMALLPAHLDRLSTLIYEKRSSTRGRNPGLRRPIRDVHLLII